MDLRADVRAVREELERHELDGRLLDGVGRLTDHGGHEGGAVLLVQVDHVGDLFGSEPDEERDLDLNRLPVLAPGAQRAALAVGVADVVPFGKLDGEELGGIDEEAVREADEVPPVVEELILVDALARRVKIDAHLVVFEGLEAAADEAAADRQDDEAATPGHILLFVIVTHISRCSLPALGLAAGGVLFRAPLCGARNVST